MQNASTKAPLTRSQMLDCFALLDPRRWGFGAWQAYALRSLMLLLAPLAILALIFVRDWLREPVSMSGAGFVGLAVFAAGGALAAFLFIWRRVGDELVHWRRTWFYRARRRREAGHCRKWESGRETALLHRRPRHLVSTDVTGREKLIIERFCSENGISVRAFLAELAVEDAKSGPAQPNHEFLVRLQSWAVHGTGDYRTELYLSRLVGSADPRRRTKLPPDWGVLYFSLRSPEYEMVTARAEEAGFFEDYYARLALAAIANQRQAAHTAEQ
jgi:hypothetical protein